MPNWCYNSVTFFGPEEKLKEFSNIIQILKNKANIEGKGVLPDFIEDDKELMSRDSMLYLFDIEYSEDAPEYLIFSSRWAPALDTIHEIGIKLGLSFEHYYDESGDLIYGVATYNHETEEYLAISLDKEDFDKIEDHYDEENHITLYYFEGKEYEVQEEILEILLERKLKDISLNN